MIVDISIVLAIIAGVSFLLWVAYDCGYDSGWWDGRYGNKEQSGR